MLNHNTTAVYITLGNNRDKTIVKGSFVKSWPKIMCTNEYCQFSYDFLKFESLEYPAALGLEN